MDEKIAYLQISKIGISIIFKVTVTIKQKKGLL
jgi:hypothetical protein